MNLKARQKIKKKALIIFPAALIVTGLILFLPAGSFSFRNAWIFIAVLFIPCIFVVSYLLKHDPELLERRMRYKEKEIEQKTIIKIATLLFLIGFITPGLDFRYGWSNVPLFLVIMSDAIIFSGYMLIFFVFRENSYTSRIIEVEKGQKVISTGPYSVVRHPMYVGVLLMYLFIPTALGSYYSLILFLPVIPVIIFRILNEEKFLTRNLPGYTEYAKKVKYRLIPGIW